MNCRKCLGNRLLSLLLCFAMIITMLPVTLFGVSAADGGTSLADPKTLSDWNTVFAPNSSRYAGGVFLDKSVYTATEAKNDAYFSAIKNQLSFGKDNFGNENFLVALSGLGSNSEVYGYSHTPTDTIFILDASTSMGTSGASTSSIDDMVTGANEAVKRLLALNNYNRVGVVIYNGTSSVLLPLDRYTATNTNKDILRYNRTNNQNRIYVASDVVNGENKDVAQTYVAQAQGTYTQGGIYAAAQQLLAADTVIEDGKIQGGTKRIPIVVLMTDGEPSYRTKTGSNTTVNNYANATNANCDNSNFREDDVTAFSTMLTAAWAEAEITAHYGEDTRFYTLGYNLSANHQYAHNVLDPMNPNNPLASRFSGFAARYLAMNKSATQSFSGAQNFRVTRQSDPAKVTSLDYVDRYWQASDASKLEQAFDSIVDEIIIQSRYYSTLVEGNQHHLDGYVSFTDEIGTHMEVKNIKGIYIGEDKLVSGGMFAEFVTTGKVTGFAGDKYSQTELQGFENEVLSSIAERFDISLSEASLLLNSAKESGFIFYTDKDTFSNYIAWYADADNKYIAPYTNIATHSDNAKYVVRSYFYMGDVTQNHVETSMLHALVRVREDIETGRQIVDMNIPAALLPMVTYTITVDGDQLTQENVTGINCEQKNPISLLFEVGLDSEITPINLEEKMAGQDFRKDANGVYTFYTNRWRDDNGNKFTIPANPDPHVFNHGIMNTTVTQFIPSLENERYYYTQNMQILDSNHQVYKGTKPSGDGYYVQYNWVEGDANSATLKSAYNPISSEVFNVDGAIIQIDGKEGWFIKKGTPQFYFGEDVHGEQAHSHKTANPTNTLGWSDYPHVQHHDEEKHTGYHILNYLGNNGLVKATPARGIKLTKSVTDTVAGAPNTFTFNIELRGTALDNSYPLYVEYADGTVNTTTVNVDRNGIVEVTIGAGDVAYITGLPTGTEYTVTEKYNSYYTAASTNANGTIAEYTISNVDFVNTPKGYGSLLVEKDVTHPFATVSAGLAAKEFDITVIFSGLAEELAEIVAPAGAQTTDGGATYTLKLKDGHDALFTKIPEGVTYTVTENNIPAGFTLLTNSAALAGTVTKDTQSEVLLVNNYQPAAVSPSIIISGEKFLSDPNNMGRVWDPQIDTYQIALQRVIFGGQGSVAVGTPVIVDVVKADNAADYTIDMSGIVYDQIGTYSYVAYEVLPDVADRVTNISYDASFAIFSVYVTDIGDGALKVSDVVVHQNTAQLTGDATGGWNIQKDFTNTYMATTIRLPVSKVVVAENNPQQIVTGHSGGIMFGLFDSVTSVEPTYSTITDDNGSATIIFPATQSEYSSVKYFYLREVIPPLDSRVVGMTYDTAIKYVISVDWSDATATEPVVKMFRYDQNAANGIGAEVTDVTEGLVITNQYDADVISNPLSFGGKKTLNGGALRTDDSFTFELYETDATFNITGLTALRTKTVDAQTAGGVYAFDPVTFDSVGTKYLVVAEKTDNADGITCDKTVYHITVDVTRATENNKTLLKAEATHIHHVGGHDVAANALDFNNIYRINDMETVVVTGKKNLTGRHLVEGEFTFGIFLESNLNTPIYTVTNDKDGRFTFPALEYQIQDQETFDQTYTYVIKEIIPLSYYEDTKGVSYGGAEYTLQVNLKDDGFGGVTKSVFLNQNAVTAEPVVVEFNNTYAAANTSLMIAGTKHLLNKQGGSYTFALFETGEDFAVVDINQPYLTTTVNLTGNSESYQLQLEYTSAHRGFHYYVLEELVPQETNGVLYDANRYFITVNVLDNGHGEMEAHVLSINSPYNDDAYEINTLDFTNRYFAKSTVYVIKGTKFLENKTLAAEQFEFTLSNSEGIIETVKNDADGNFAFTAQEFQSAGNYTFFVTEEKGGNTEKGITYDKAVYTVTIPVIDDTKGKLIVDEANITIKKTIDETTTDAAKVEFHNVYDAAATDKIYLNGTKNLIGRTLAEKEFTFELYAANANYAKGELLATAFNEANGSFKFDNALEYQKVGVYRYVVIEKVTDEDGITFDKTVYGVEAEVTDDQNGKLQIAEMKYFTVQDGKTEAAEKVEFTNVFTPKPVEKPTEPKPTEPKPTEPKPTEPKPTEPKPTEPKPTEPKPTEPKPTEPKPTEPKPTEPKPTAPPVIPNNPLTSDTVNVRVLIAVLLASGVGLGFTVFAVLAKKKKEENP